MNKHNKKPRNEDMSKDILTLKTLEECMNFSTTCVRSRAARHGVCVTGRGPSREGTQYSDTRADGRIDATISRVNRQSALCADGYQVAFEAGIIEGKDK